MINCDIYYKINVLQCNNDAVCHGCPRLASIGLELCEVSPDGAKALNALFAFIAQIVYAEHYNEKLQYQLAGVKRSAKDFEEFCTRSEEMLKASRAALEESIDNLFDDRDKSAFDPLWQASWDAPAAAGSPPKANAPKMPSGASNIGFQGGVLKK